MSQDYAENIQVWFRSFEQPDNTGVLVDLGVHAIETRVSSWLGFQSITIGASPELVERQYRTVRLQDRTFIVGYTPWGPRHPHPDWEVTLPHGFNPFVKVCPTCGSEVPIESL